MKTIRLTIENRRADLMLVFIEPEAMDFWLKPGEECVVSAPKEEDEAHFELQYTDQGVTVFPSAGCGGIRVFQNEIKLVCGHQRPRD